VIVGGVGHNLPQEAPQAFAQAIIEVACPEGAPASAKGMNGYTDGPQTGPRP
jgi:hypothetical protein